MTTVRVDPDIAQVQKEWEESIIRHPLLQNSGSNELQNSNDFKYIQFKDKDFDIDAHINFVREHFDTAAIGSIAKIWFTCCKRGERISFPHDRWSLLAYTTYHHPLFVVLVRCSMLLIFLSPIVTSSSCTANNNDDTTLQSFVILSCLLYLWDRFLFVRSAQWKRRNLFGYYITNSVQWDNGHLWCMMGIFSGVVILLNQIVHLASAKFIPDLCKCLFVFLVGAKSYNFAEIFEGLYFSVRKSASLLGLLVFLILFWSFAGFCLFRRFETYSNSFSSFSQALYTCLHSVLSRPTVLYRLQPLYFENNFSAMYFVLLTLFGDITFIALIIAVGTRNFRDFSAKNFKARLKYRKIAAEALFKLYATARVGDDATKEEAMITLDQFVELGRRLGSSAAAHTPERARFIFSTEDSLSQGKLNLTQFVRLLAMMSCAVRVLSDNEIRDERRVFDLTDRPFQISQGQGDPATQDRDSQRQEESDREKEDVLSFWKLFRRKVRDAPSDSIVAQSSESEFPRGSNSIVANPVLASLSLSNSDLNPNPNPNHSPRSSSSSVDKPFSPSSLNSFSATRLQMSAVNASALAHRLQVSDKSLHIPFLTRMLNENQQLKSVISESICQANSFSSHDGAADRLSDQHHRDTHTPPSRDPLLKRCSQSILRTVATLYWLLIIQVELWELELRIDIIRRLCFRVYSYCVNLPLSISPGAEPGRDRRLLVNVLQSASFSAMVLLLVQLGYLAKREITTFTLAAGWLLIIYFYFETVISSLGSFKSKFSLRAQWIINAINLVVYSGFWHSGTNPRSPWIVLVVLASMLRFQQWIKFLPRADVLKAIAPIVFRCVFFYIMVVYFFTVIGYQSFCDLYTSDYSYSVNDDAGSWMSFSSYLNFNTFLSSAYSSAMVAVMSNWSIVMDAGVRCAGPASDKAGGVYLFFFLLRITLVWIVIPTLMSFVIQFFTQKLSKPAKVPKPVIWSVMTSEQVGKCQGRLEVVGGAEADLHNIALKKKHKPEVMVQLWSSSGQECLPTIVSPLETQITELERNIDMAYRELEELNKKIINIFSQLRAAGEDLPNENKNLPEDDLVLYYVAESHIVKEQQDWVALMKSQSQRQSIGGGKEDATAAEQSVRRVATQLDRASHFEVASIWFQDALDGHALDFPRSGKAFEVRLLALSRSHAMKMLLYSLVLVQMVILLFNVPSCANTVDGNVGSSLISRNAVAIVECVASLLYIADVSLDIFVMRGRLAQKISRSWVTVRLVCSFLMFFSSVLILAYKVKNDFFGVVRSVYPLLLISRDENFKQLMKGLLVSVRNSWMVYSLLISLLVAFSLCGYFLFHRVETSASHFSDLVSAFYVVLHCFTSAPYSLFVITPYISSSGATPLFFLLLSYCTEVFCIGLVLGTGTFFYRSFSDNTLKDKLVKRHEGIQNIWLLLADPATRCISLDDWLLFCTKLPVAYQVQPNDAFDLFKYVCRASPLDDLTGGRIEEKALESIDRPQFFRLCSLLVIGARSRRCDSVTQLRGILNSASPHRCVDDQAIKDVLNSLWSEGDRESTSVAVQMEMVAARRKSATLRRSSTHSIEKTANSFRLFPWGSGKASPSKADPSRQSSRSRSQRKSSMAESVRSTIAYTKERVTNYNFDGLFRRVNVIYIRESRRSLFTYEQLGIVDPTYRSACEKIVLWCQVAVSVEFLGNICIFELANGLMHVLLIVYLLFFTSVSQTSLSWLKLGYFLTAYFLSEAIVRILAIGEQSYFKNNVYRFQFGLNVLSFVFMVAMGSNINDTGTFFLLTVLVQCARVGLMLWIERGDDKLKILLGVAGRALFLLVSAIYCFGVISQSVFCGVLSTQVDPGYETNDDDASSWFVFANLLNFNTYAQSTFTMFQVVVLGSWSMIMDAIIRSERTTAGVYIYFYFFRLLLTLVVLPLLLSFLVRSSVALNDKIRNERQFREAQSKLLKEEEEKKADGSLHRPLPPVMAGGRQPIIQTMLARIRRFVWGGSAGGSPENDDGGGSGNRTGVAARKGTRELFSQYNISVTKQGDNMTFSSIWSVDAGAGESLKFLRILALSTQLENVKYNLDYHCELMLLSLDQLNEAKTKKRRDSVKVRRSILGGVVDLSAEEPKAATEELGEGNAYEEDSKVGVSDGLREGEDDEEGAREGQDNTEEDEDGSGEQLTQFFKERAQTRHSLVSYMT